MRSVLAMLTLCACSDPPGLEIEIIAGDGVAKVELIPADSCETCPQNLAAPGTRIRSEEAFTSTQPTRWLTDTQDGRATFRLISETGGDDKLPFFMAVGFDANDTAIAALPVFSVQVPSQRGEYWQVRLDRDSVSVAGIDDVPHPDGTVQVAVWRAPTQTQASCVMFEGWDAGMATTGAIMPPEDPDCDAANPECLANVPNAQGTPPPLNQSSCGATKQLPSGSVCLLGGTACTDGVPAPDSSCVPIADDMYCIPQQACACETCATSAFLSTTNVPYINCSVSIDQAGKPCNGGNTNLDASIFLGGQAKCLGFHFLPGFLTGLQIKDTIPLGSTATMALSDFQQTCSVTITVAGVVSSGANSIELADLALENGRHLVIPFRVHAEGNGCQTPTVCTPFKPTYATETIYNCTR